MDQTQFTEALVHILQSGADIETIERQIGDLYMEMGFPESLAREAARLMLVHGNDPRFSPAMRGSDWKTSSGPTPPAASSSTSASGRSKSLAGLPMTSVSFPSLFRRTKSQPVNRSLFLGPSRT